MLCCKHSVHHGIHFSWGSHRLRRWQSLRDLILQIFSWGMIPLKRWKNKDLVTFNGMSGIATFMRGGPVCDVWWPCVRCVVALCAMCGAPVCCSCDSIWKGLCAGKASVYLSKRINSFLLTKIFISWHWLRRMWDTESDNRGPLLFIVQWVIRNKAWFKHNYKTM